MPELNLAWWKAFSKPSMVQQRSHTKTKMLSLCAFKLVCSLSYLASQGFPGNNGGPDATPEMVIFRAFQNDCLQVPFGLLLSPVSGFFLPFPGNKGAPDATPGRVIWRAPQKDRLEVPISPLLSPVSGFLLPLQLTEGLPICCLLKAYHMHQPSCTTN